MKQKKHTLLYPRTPMIARNIPTILIRVTGFFSNIKDTVMMAILFVAFATAYVSGVTNLRMVKVTTFCNQFNIPSKAKKVRVNTGSLLVF